MLIALTVREPRFVLESIRTELIVFFDLEYGALIATCIFLGVFSLNLFKPREKERPVLDFLLSLVAAVFFTLIIAAITNHILSIN